MGMDFSPLWVSLKTSLAATIFAFITGIIAAWLIAGYKGRFKGLIDSILTLPMVLPPTVVGFILLVILGKNSVIGKLLNNIGYNLIFTWQAIVIAASVVAFPLMYKTSRGAFEQIDRNIVDAARTLGVCEWKIFIKVCVPNAWPGILAGTVLAFARALGEFGATLMVGGSMLGKTQTIPIAIYFASEGGNTREAYIWVGIIFGISLMVMAAVNYWNDRQQKNSSSGIGGK
ncbi:MAG: molybdate ABC transporter permease subunit [Eubacteriaceae bacterium]|nr:molybdate ABC transporter permease subunit [Eubacteriaceae bacterium]